MSPSSLYRTNKSSVSPIALPLLQALSQGRFNDVRRLTFGQVALTGHHQATISVTNKINQRDENLLLITKRNDHALQQIFTEFDRHHKYIENNQNNNHGRDNDCTLALLYGCNHCPDLHLKLMHEGFQPIESQWRTAWTANSTPSWTHTTANSGASEKSRTDTRIGTSTVSFLVLFLLPPYFLIGGYDWMEMIVDVVRTFENNDDFGAAATILLFYIARHVLLYLSLSKFVLDGDNSKLS
jgi:hypothetical protein